MVIIFKIANLKMCTVTLQTGIYQNSGRLFETPGRASETTGRMFKYSAGHFKHSVGCLRRLAGCLKRKCKHTCLNQPRYLRDASVYIVVSYAWFPLLTLSRRINFIKPWFYPGFGLRSNWSRFEPTSTTVILT